MSKLRKQIWVSLLVISLVMIPSLVACSGAPTSQPAPGGAWKWPERLQVAAVGQGAQVKMVSYFAPLEAAKNIIIRVQPEAKYVNVTPLIKDSKIVWTEWDRVDLARVIEASDEHATLRGGPFMPGITWIASLGFSGWMVRGDSPMNTPRDIKPGTRFAVSSMKTGTLLPNRAILAWAGLNEKDIIWVNVGSSDAEPRAITEGRADITFTPPISASTIEAAATPGGIKFLDMNPNKDPEGLLRFLSVRPMYSFTQNDAGPKNTHGTWMPGGYKPAIANYSTDPELIYNIAKWLEQNYDLYWDKYESNRYMTFQHLMQMLNTTFIPVHPGLVKYLKEKNAWTEAHEKRNQYNIAWMQKYIDAYAEGIKLANSKNVSIDPLNEKWLELWENFKKEKQLPVIGMHPSLTQNAAIVVSPGYIPPEQEQTAPPPPLKQDVPVEVASIKNFATGNDVELTVKTLPGASVKVVFTMPNGNNSRYPDPNTLTADQNGLVSFKWNIHSSVPKGTGKLTITATKDGKTGELVYTDKI